MDAAELDRLVVDPRWLFFQLDTIGARALFYQADEAVYRDSLFLDERIALRDPVRAVVPLAELSRRLGDRPPQADFIFHVGHCGSTLLSRLLEAAAGVLALREPVPLRALAAFLRDRDHPLGLVAPEAYPALERTVLGLLSRRFDDTRKTVLKATSDCGVLAQSALDHDPHNRAVCLTLSLEQFLATMLRSELRRQETAHFAQSRLADLHRRLGAEDIRIYRLGIGELTAMSWASSMLTLARARERFAERVLWLDFVDLLDDFEGVLARVCDFLELGATAADVARAVNGGLLENYSKDPTLRYGRAAREAELDRCRRRHGDQIDAGRRWAERLVADRPEAAPLGGQLD